MKHNNKKPKKSKCQYCNNIGKLITKYYYGHRNSIYVGLYSERVYRCLKHEENI